MVRYNRMFAMVLTFVMVFTLAVAPALSVSAESASSNSLEINVDAEVGGVAYNGKLYFDIVNEVLAIVGSMGDGNETYMDAALYIGSAGLAVSANPFLDQVYGVDLQHLRENLPGSVFAPDSGSQLALDQETYDMLMGGMEGALASQITATIDPELMEKGMNALMPHLENCMNAMMQNAQIAAGPRTLSLPTGDVKATASTITVNGAAIAEGMIALINSLAEDPDTQDILAQVYDELVSSGTITVSEDMQGVTGKEFFDTIFQNKDELCQELTESLSASNVTISGSAAADQQTEELVSIGLEITADGEPVGFELVFAGGTYSFEVRNGSDSTMVAFCILENTEKLLSATLSGIENGTEAISYALNWNKEAGTYELVMSTDSSTGILTGTITSDDTSTTITFDEIEGQSLGNTYIKLSSNDPITFPSYKEILTMSEDEILQVVQNVSSIMQQLSE